MSQHHLGDRDFELALLRAGGRDSAPADGAERLVAAMGLGAGAAVTVAVTTSTAKGTLAASSMLMKVMAGAIAVASVAGVTVYARSASRPAVGTTTRPESRPEPRNESRGVPVGAAPETDQAVSVDDLPRAPETAAPRPTTVAPEIKAPPTDHALLLAREVARIADAEAALRAGDPAAAERAVHAYRREFPAGTLAPEALALEVDALLMRGEATEARTLAQRFLVLYPSAPHAARMRRVASGP